MGLRVVDGRVVVEPGLLLVFPGRLVVLGRTPWMVFPTEGRAAFGRITGR